MACQLKFQPVIASSTWWVAEVGTDVGNGVGVEATGGSIGKLFLLSNRKLLLAGSGLVFDPFAGSVLYLMGNNFAGLRFMRPPHSGPALASVMKPAVTVGQDHKAIRSILSQ